MKHKYAIQIGRALSTHKPNNIRKHIKCKRFTINDTFTYLNYTLRKTEVYKKGRKKVREGTYNTIYTGLTQLIQNFVGH